MHNDSSVGRVVGIFAAGLGTDIAVISLLGKLAEGALKSETKAVDKEGTHLVRDTEHPALDPVTSLLSGIGEPNTLYPVAGLLAALWWAKGRPADALTIGIAVAGSSAVDKAVKLIVKRPRPRTRFHRQRTSGSSFPSQHVAMSLATYGTAVYLINRRTPKKQRRPIRLWAPVLLLCAMIGWSRVYKGVHHPTDVLGGVIAGAIWFATCAEINQSLTAKKGRRHA
ncbi:MAG: phosphatase PAP2 family protein [Chloroflexia bacterium]